MVPLGQITTKYAYIVYLSQHKYMVRIVIQQLIHALCVDRRIMTGGVLIRRTCVQDVEMSDNNMLGVNEL